MTDVNERELGPIDNLYREIRSVLERARNNAYQAVNFSMVQAYWQIT